MDNLTIARIAHEVNRAYCEAIGDHSQVSWKNAEQWQRDSAINGVTFSINNPNSTPEDQHEEWLNSKLKDGWIYGSIKNAEEKQHPCIMSYNNLPKEQKIKDALFLAVVNACKEEKI